MVGKTPREVDERRYPNGPVGVMPVSRYRRIPLYIGMLGCFVGVLCLPPLAYRLFALEPLHPDDYVPLWVFSLLLVFVSLVAAFTRWRWRDGIAALLIPVLALVVLEMTARIYVRGLDTPERTEIILLARRTHRDQMAFQPHPFLQFTGRPGATLRRDDVLGTLAPFSELGFRGPALDKVKPERTTRITCLGGSTTASGYPAEMEEILQRRVGPSHRFEVMNLGTGWYTSLHSALNFVVHGVDYSPDYVVFHHAINDGWGRGRRTPVRGDYTHFLIPFEYPSIPDALLIRASVIYRCLKQRVTGEPDWAFLDAAVVRDEEREEGDPYAELGDLDPYKRNIRCIVDIALARGITPVLVTQPHSMDPKTGFETIEEHMRQANTLLRELAETYRGKVLIVDLDARCTGHNDLFVDWVHMTEAGRELKARIIANVVLEHWRASGNRAESPPTVLP